MFNMNTRGNVTADAIATSKGSLDTILRLTGVSKFRPDQLLMLHACGIDGDDVWAQLPCGAGKTVGFVSSYITRIQSNGGGIGILIEPTVALLFQLQTKLEALNITVYVLSEETRSDICTLLKQHNPTAPIIIVSNPQQIVHKDVLLALAPPSLTTPIDYTSETLPTSPVVLVCIDEAHLISKWSVGFIYAFGQLGSVIKILETWAGRRPPIMFTTGTASADVRQAVKQSLRVPMASCVEILRSPRNPQVDFKYLVSGTKIGGKQHKKKRDLLLTQVAKNQVVVVYCNTIVQCITRMEEFNILLKNIRPGLRSDVYHGEHSNEKRREITKLFSQAAVRCAWENRDGNGVQYGTDDRLMVVFATASFTMGIDIYGINVIIFWEMPRTIDSIIQGGNRGARAPNSTSTTYVFISWSGYLSLIQQARDIYLKAATTPGETKSNGGHSQGRRIINAAAQLEAEQKQVLAHSQQVEKEITTVYSLSTSPVCRECLHEEEMGTHVGVNCGRCDNCTGTNVIQDWDAVDIAINHFFRNSTMYGKTITRAVDGISKALNSSTTKPRIAERIRYFVTTLQTLRLIKNNFQTLTKFVVVQGKNWIQVPVAVEVDDGEGSGTNGEGASSAAVVLEEDSEEERELANVMEALFNCPPLVQ